MPRSHRRAAILGVLLGLGAAGPVGGADRPAAWADLPPNVWTLLSTEGAVEENRFGRGRVENKVFAQAVVDEATDRVYLWGLGGDYRDRASYEPYELEHLSLGTPGRAWEAALPAAKRADWAGWRWPRFQIHGYNGTDGTRIVTVGTGSPNRVAFLDADGVRRPSPVYTFHQACYDSKRKRLIYFAGGKTLALDPASNTWRDLAPPHAPRACDSLAWASLCYDPVNDEVLLFGGGLACTAEGGARTWLYDCAANDWRRPRLDAEPPLRCTAPIVYSPGAGAMVLFGGYDQAAARNDTWVYRCRERRWEERRPNPSPPPMFAPAAAALPGGNVLVCGRNATAGERTTDATETWVYDVAADAWHPLGTAKMAGRWQTAAASARHGVALLVNTAGTGRQTYALRYDATAKPTSPLRGSPPGTRWFRYPEQKDSLTAAPPPDAAAHSAFLKRLPANRFVNPAPPGTLIARTWSGATVDTDRGEVIYTGGGHSGYTGNDVAVYSVAENRWALDAEPRFPPFLDGTNAAVYGLSYGGRPWSQHTYLWYGYDPVSRTVVYCARPTLRDGETVALGDTADTDFVYDRKKHGTWTWTFDPAARRLSLPSFGRPFDNPWELSLTGTPKGVFACTRDGLYRASVEAAGVSWTPLGGPVPPPPGAKYHYEWMPIVYDGKRDRLLHLMGDDGTVEVHTRGLNAPAWAPLPTTGRVAIGREAMYLPKADALLLLARDRLFALDLATSAWRELDVALPKGQYGVNAAMVYDPRTDVCVLVLPQSNQSPVEVFLFRYDPGTARFKAPR